MYLDSAQNPRIKSWASLKTKKGRTAQGEFIVEGIRLVDELLHSSLVVKGVIWDVGTDELPDSLMDAALERGVPVFEVSPNAYKTISDTITPQGVLAIAELPRNAQSDGVEFPSHVLFLDGVQDPGNVGTLIRTADAFGIHGVCCGSGTADPYSPKVVRATMGGLFRTPVFAVDGPAYVEEWKTHWPDGQVILTSANADTVCYDADFQKPSLIVVGSEAFGVSQPLTELSSFAVQIPMGGKAESLNAAIAGAVILYEVSRQRR